MTIKARKQLTFAKDDDIDLIEEAVEKLNKEAKDGQIVSVNRFIAQKALEGAKQVLNQIPVKRRKK